MDDRGAAELRAAVPALAELITARHYRVQPGLAERYGPEGRARCIEDCQSHLSCLSEALATDCPALFVDYVGWVKALIARYGVPADHLAVHLRCMQETLREQLPADRAQRAAECVELGVAALTQPAPSVPSFLDPEAPHAALARDYLQALRATDRHRARALIVDAFHGGVPVNEIYLHVFQPCQFEVGRLWHLGDVSVAEEHFCTAVTQSIMGHLYPSIFASPRSQRTAVVCCVGNELHELGARMVADFLELAGWDTVYLGANTPPQGIAVMVSERGADLVCLSVTLTRHLHLVVASIAAVRQRVAPRRVPILVGGYPFRMAPDLWQRIGADGCARDADSCVELAGQMIDRARA